MGFGITKILESAAIAGIFLLMVCLNEAPVKPESCTPIAEEQVEQEDEEEQEEQEDEEEEEEEEEQVEQEEVKQNICLTMNFSLSNK